MIMKNSAIYRVLLDAIAHNGGPELDEVHVEFKRKPGTSNPRKFEVIIAPPMNAVIADFELSIIPNQLSKQIPGGVATAAPKEWTVESLLEALKTDMGVDLKGDTFELMRTDTTTATIYTLSATADTMLFDGQLEVACPTNPFHTLAMTKGGTVGLSNKAQINQAFSLRRLSTLLADISPSGSGKISRVLTDSFYVAGMPSHELQMTLSGPDGEPDHTTRLTYGTDQESITDLHVCGQYELNANGDVPDVLLFIGNVDRNGDSVVSWTGKFDRDGWIAAPITSNESNFRVVNNGNPEKAVAATIFLKPFRQRYIGQDVAEYQPIPDTFESKYITFDGFQRLESDIQPLTTIEQFIGVELMTADLPTIGESELISLQGHEHSILRLRYRASDRSFIATYYNEAEVVFNTIDWATVGDTLTVGVTVGNFRLAIHAQNRTTHVDALGQFPFSGRLRLGGETASPFTISQMFHYRGYVTDEMARWFVSNLQ